MKPHGVATSSEVTVWSLSKKSLLSSAPKRERVLCHSAKPTGGCDFKISWLLQSNGPIPHFRVPQVSFTRHGHGMGDLASHASLSFAALKNTIATVCIPRHHQIALQLQKAFLVYTEFGRFEMVIFKILIEVFKAYPPYISQNYHCTYNVIS